VTLNERIHGVRACSDCHRSPALPDAAQCGDCLDAFLRRTRPDTVREVAWLTYQREHGRPKEIVA
jgi:hypothetical protein